MRRGQIGQILVWMALFLPLMVLLLLGALEAAADLLRMQETIAAADLAAHAGVQAAVVRPDGRVVPAGDAGAFRATQVFLAHRPSHARLVSARCYPDGARIACRVVAETRTVGWFPLIGQQSLRVSAVAYMVPGATRGEQ